MSTTLGSRRNFVEHLEEFPSAFRAFALAGAAVLTGAYLATLFHVVDVVGGPGGLELFLGIVAGALGLAVVLGGTLRLRYALVLGALFLVAGLGAYLVTVPGDFINLERQFQDTVALVTGLSVLRMTNAAVWALGFTPGPLFVSAYLFIRRRYALGVLVGGATLGFFISTGDIGAIHGLVGTLGAVAALGFGRLDREGGSAAQRDVVVVLLVAILVVTTSVSLVPGGEARPLLPGDYGRTVESTLVDTGDSVSVLGSIELSPTARFVVTAQRASRWRIGAFDRYTGSGWVRAGQATPYENQLGRPEGNNVIRIRQTFEVQSSTTVMPAAWKPTRVERSDAPVRVSSMGGLQPRGNLETGDVYTVVSHRNVPSPASLRQAGTDYHDAIDERYTQLPESTPERVETFTSRLTAQATNPYDTARVIERWLKANKGYSLNVDRPGGDVAASFLFEMDRGYCTYFATAMVSMLRSQGIPARFVVGYTTGDRVAENRWLVRGLDSHAWVEVYFPDHGWVAFDPTPAGPREEAESSRLAQARAAGVGDVDFPTPTQPGGDELDDGGQVTTTGPAGVLGPDFEGVNGTPTIPGVRGPEQGIPGAAGDGLGGGLPDRQTTLYGVILLAGAATAAHRTGLLGRGRRLVWVRRRPDGSPARRVEATFERLDYLLGRRYRPRGRDETPRAYLEAIRSRAGPPDGPSLDPRVDQLFELYERAHYAGRVSPGDAERAWELLNEVREEWSVWS